MGTATDLECYWHWRLHGYSDILMILRFLEHADPLLKVSIVPRSSGALGFAQYLPAEMLGCRISSPLSMCRVSQFLKDFVERRI